MDSILLSCVIPVYNTSVYLEKCLKSIIEQSMASMEIILIDDGSTDDSGIICDRYEEKYPLLVKTVHKENGGQSSARNVGLAQAHGKYIFFIDSDDYLEARCLEKILNGIKSDADVYEFGFNVFREEKLMLSQSPIECSEPVATADYLKRIMNKYTYEWYPWKYIFKKELFESTKTLFPEGMYYEDVYLMPRVLLGASSIQTINIVGYNYILGRPGATTNGIKTKNEKDKLRVIEANIKFCSKLEDSELKKLLCDNFSKMYYSVLMVCYGIKNKEERSSLFQILSEMKWMLKYTLSGPQVSLKRMIYIIGLKNTARLLHLRRVMKKWMNIHTV